MIPNERSRPEGCATDLKLDAWFAGELSAGAVAELAAHVDACARCRTRRAALATEREAFFALQPRPRARAARAASRPGRVVVLGVVLAAAAAVALAVWPGGTQLEPTVRTKGSTQLGFFVQRSGVATRGVPGEVVHPGDLIRFVYTSERPVYLAIYALDAAGTVSVYFPDATAAQRLPAAHDAELDTSVALDGVLGTETVFALFCEHSFQVAELRASFASARMKAQLAGCRVESLTWNKQGEP